MHRTNRKAQILFCSVLLGLALGGTALAQQPAPQSPPAAAAGGAQATGRGNTLIVAINGTQRVQMTTRKRIARVDNPKENVLRVQPVANDPSAVIITGLDAGVTRLTLTDEAGAQESIDVIVQLDVEYLRTLLQRAVPTASVGPVPGSNNTIILMGSVARAEDIDVIMRTAVSVVGNADRVVNAMRVGGVQQVQLDVVVAQVSRGEFRRMAFDFIEVGRQHIVSSTVGGAFLLPSTGIAGTLPGAPVIQNSIGSPNGVPSNLFAGVFNQDQGFFGLLQALRDENVAKLLAEPKVVVLSGRPASFLSGGEQAIPVPAGLGQVGVQFEEFGTRLNVLPIILGTGKIHLEIEPEVSDLNPSFGTSINGTVVPGRTTQRIHTTVELEDGQTFVLGGLIQRSVVGNTTKVPILGDLPFVGTMFSRKAFNEVESELVIVVTPHLVDAMACDQAPKVFPGQETRSPDNFELFLEGILEAPRGPRAVCPNHRYVPAFKNGPTSAVFPCGGDGQCGKTCGAGCPTGGCAGQGEPLGGLHPASMTSPLWGTAGNNPAPANDTIRGAVSSGSAAFETEASPGAGTNAMPEAKPPTLPSTVNGASEAPGQ